MYFEQSVHLRIILKIDLKKKGSDVEKNSLLSGYPEGQAAFRPIAACAFVNMPRSSGRI